MDFIEGEVLYFNKPLTWTSFDLVNYVRRALCRHLKVKAKSRTCRHIRPFGNRCNDTLYGEKRQKIESLQDEVKEYVTTLKLGATTPSFDLEHPIDNYYPTEHITRELVEEKISTFVGEIWQTPPVYSAIKIEGERAFNYARKGKEVELKPKLLVIDKIEILKFDMPSLTIRVTCSKGTYIRALARDIGIALGSGAHLTALERTRIGNITIADCMDAATFVNELSKKQD